MTDTRLPDKWLNDRRFLDLSADAWRLFTMAMMWCNQQATDGAISTRYLRMLHPDLDPAALIPELISLGVLETTDDGIQFLDWSKELGQSTAAAVEERRRKWREAQVRHRSKNPPPRSEVVIDDIPNDVGHRTLASEAKKPVSYVSDDVINDICPRHPNGDTGEPCGGCARVKANRQTVTGGEWKALEAKCRREGHDFPPGEWYCSRCASKRDPNAWMDPDSHRKEPADARI